MAERSPSTTFTVCGHDGCEASYANHRWGQTKADGWWIPRDSDKPSFCPEHLPEWVEAWRARKRNT